MDCNRDIDLKRWEEEWFREFRKQLPKSWHIEEAGLNADTVPTTPTTPMGHTPTFVFGFPKFTKKGDLRSSDKGSQIGVGSSGVDEYEGQFHFLGMKDVLRGCKRIAIIGIHGWFPGVFSSKFLSREWILKTTFFPFRCHVTDSCWRRLFFLYFYYISFTPSPTLFSQQGPAPSLPI